MTSVELISDELRHRLVAKAEQQAGSREFAERSVAEALEFLQACARRPGERLSPSPTADIGWHAFILHTREYAEFCQRIAGGFIHHEPLGGTCEAHECKSFTDCDNGVSCANNCRSGAGS